MFEIIVAPIFRIKVGSCEILLIPNAVKGTTFFVLITLNIIGSLDDLVGQKITSLPKARRR